MRILFLLGVVTLWAKNSNAAAVANTGAQDTITKSLNTFSDKFFKKVAEGVSGDLICSPMSASMAVAMAAFGARGNTQKQLRSALALPSDDTVTKNGLQRLVDSFKSFTEFELRLANKIFVAQGVTMKPDFKSVSETYFRSAAQNLNFGKNVQAAKTINDWAKAQTNNRITDLIKPKHLSANTALVLVNAVYFKGSWADEFDSDDTKPLPFHVDATTVKELPTMYRFGKYQWGELSDVKAKFIELPYKSKDDSDAVSMFIIVPDEINGLANLEKNLDKVTVDRLLRGSSRHVDLYLPKFKIESELDLKAPFDKMGLTDMFTPAADFSGIAAARRLKISKVVQKAFIEVDEKGSEAGVATALIEGPGAGWDPEAVLVEMRVDRPFLYAIVLRSSRSIIFQGRYRS